jgi:hypothetical protein
LDWRFHHAPCAFYRPRFAAPYEARSARPVSVNDALLYALMLDAWPKRMNECIWDDRNTASKKNSDDPNQFVVKLPLVEIAQKNNDGHETHRCQHKRNRSRPLKNFGLGLWPYYTPHRYWHEQDLPDISGDNYKFLNAPHFG